MEKWLKKIAKGNKGFGLNELLGAAAAIILAALVVIPGLTNMGKDAMEKMQDWWNGVAAKIFVEKVSDIPDPPYPTD